MEAAAGAGAPGAHQVSYKVLLLGDSGVGKTSISRALRGDQFIPTLIATVGIDFVTSYFSVDGCVVRLQVWDTAGQERFRTITKFHYRGSKGLVLVFDITEYDSFEHIRYWFNSIAERDLDAEQVILVGNKCDLESQRQVPTREAQKFATSKGLKYFECSCKSNTNIRAMFQQLALDILDANSPHLMSAYNKSLAEHYRERTDSAAGAGAGPHPPSSAPNGRLIKLTGRRHDKPHRTTPCCSSIG